MDDVSERLTTIGATDINEVYAARNDNGNFQKRREK
jgi:hypothetical protein